MMAESVYERGRMWYWADETWGEHGPCSSRESAVRRQAMYVRYCLEGVPRTAPPDTPRPCTPTEWSAARERESEQAIHPCNCAAPWDCECAGACSCHWST